MSNEWNKVTSLTFDHVTLFQSFDIRQDCTAITNEDTCGDVVIGLSALHKQVICLKMTDAYLLQRKVLLFRQTFTLSYQIWTKCSSPCAPLQNSLPWFIHIAWGYKAARTQYRLDADKTRRSATLTHSWACGGCSGPGGRSWSPVGWRYHSWSFGTEEGGPEEETLNICHSQLHELDGCCNAEYSCLGGSLLSGQNVLDTNNEGNEISIICSPEIRMSLIILKLFFQKSGLFLL